MSVTDNVVMGENIPEAKKTERVEEALKLSGAYDKVMSLKHGMGTTLTNEFDDEGAVLSGGEYQKIVVARAFVKQCPFKVFDEPSSALDPLAEYNMYNNMMKLSEGRGVIFISHRLSSARMADEIYLMKDGEVVESGTHEELIANQSFYHEMFTLQAENYQESLPEEMLKGAQAFYA